MRHSGKDSEVVTLLYIPGLHDGYFKFFSRHLESGSLWIVDEELASEFFSFHREIRAISAQMMKIALEALGLFDEVRVLTKSSLSDFKAKRIITASENVSRSVTQKYFPNVPVEIDNYFLRYDEGSVKSVMPANFDRTSTDSFDLQIMRLAFDVADKSSDWWRHVGVVVVKDGVIVAVDHNKAVPSVHMPYVFGNPRDFIEAGTLSHFSDSLHGEDGVFAQLLRKGVSTEGAHIYSSVFPCPRCSKLIAHCGISKCFAGSGHASLDGEKVLRSEGVELIYVPVWPRT